MKYDPQVRPKILGNIYEVYSSSPYYCYMRSSSIYLGYCSFMFLYSRSKVLIYCYFTSISYYLLFATSLFQPWLFFQVVIVPIWKKEEEKSGVLDAAIAAYEVLKSAGIKVKVDDSEQRTPGWKFNFWEMKVRGFTLDHCNKVKFQNVSTFSIWLYHTINISCIVAFYFIDLHGQLALEIWLFEHHVILWLL